MVDRVTIAFGIVNYRLHAPIPGAFYSISFYKTLNEKGCVFCKSMNMDIRVGPLAGAVEKDSLQISYGEEAPGGGGRQRFSTEPSREGGCRQSFSTGLSPEGGWEGAL